MGLTEFVRSADYPGRVVVLGRDTDDTPFFLYALSGRSEASRQRAFRSDAWHVEVYDTRGAGDDPLRHYVAARFSDGTVVVGNGDHVDDVHARLAADASLESAVEPVLPEPDPPIWTPRIGAVTSVAPSLAEATGAFGVRGRLDGGTVVPERHVVSLAPLTAGHALAVKTYSGSTADVVTDGVPVVIEVDAPWTQLLAELHEAISADLRVGVVGSQLTASGFDLVTHPA